MVEWMVNVFKFTGILVWSACGAVIVTAIVLVVGQFIYGLVRRGA